MAAPESERREPTLVRLSIDPAPGRLRETLAAVDEGLGDLEAPTLSRVRLILSEIVGRSTEGRGEIHIEIAVLPEIIRIELAGQGLALPEHPSFQHGEARPSFPLWVLSDLADHWGVDRRRAEPGIWLLLGRA